jgi:sulfoxide reductase catalytic subunit YedY
MFIHEKNPLDPVGGSETPESVCLNRRKWLRSAGLLIGAGALAGGGYAGWRVYRGSDEDVIKSGQVTKTPTVSNAKVPEEDYETRLERNFPATLDGGFEYGREETDRAEAARYTNFYEFSSLKSSWRYVDDFQPYPWTIEVAGLCRNPMKLDLNDFHQQYADHLVERQYRHRCVEKWAMAIPWSGVPLAKIIEHADPMSEATHVNFVTFMRPKQASQQQNNEYPWPYTEGLTLAEATNTLTLLGTGIYGRPLLKQHGAPVRLVVPWKYGFKSIKSIERIEFVDREPPTFWNTLRPDAYSFSANVDPAETYPWPQRREWMLGSREEFPTQLYNGYADYVAELYQT